MNEPEHQLIVEAQQGNRVAQGRLLRPFEQPLFLYLLRMLRRREDAEDALQNTFVQTLKALPKYRHEGHFRSWLYRIAHREALQLIRKHPEIEHESKPAQTDPAPPPDALAAAAELKQIVREAIASLPDSEREVVTLRLDAGLTFREIAETTDSPLGTTLGRMRQALNRLKPQLENLQ